jgi:sec-independent protein translocase protein TatA
MPQGFELIIIAGVIVFVFGASKLPKFARSLGQAQNEFRKGQQEALEDPEREKRETPPS